MATTAILANARIVTPAKVLDPGWIRIVDDRIADLGQGDLPDQAEALIEDLGRMWLVPGFIDLHCHGGGGGSFTDEDPDQILRALDFHRRHGTTRLIASVVSAPIETMSRWVTQLANLSSGAANGRLLGCHLEGPFLSPARRGAHDVGALRLPDPSALGNLLESGAGTVRMVSLAPELPGGLDLVRLTTAVGAIAAIGHTDATFDEAVAAVGAGAAQVTHLFNGMRPLHHREPGVAGAALDRDELTCELVNDGVHLHDAAVRLAFARKGPDGIVLVTDAIAAAGMPDGPYRLGSMDVRVVDGRAVLADGSSIAGSTLTMDRAVRRAVNEGGLPLADVVVAASTTPARIAGLSDRVGSIESGKDADLVVLDEDLEVHAVMGLGRWVNRPRE